MSVRCTTFIFGIFSALTAAVAFKPQIAYLRHKGLTIFGTFELLGNIAVAPIATETAESSC